MKTQIYPWQQGIWHEWQSLLKAKHFPHAALYACAKGSGRLAFTAMLAKTLLCTKSDSLACEQCHSCQLFNAGTHPDFHHLHPEEQGKQIGIEAIRTGNKFAWQSSQLGSVRVILIEHADQMGEAAANALLKTLEEPPLQCHFILLASALSNMLPTILSRCNKWMLPLLPELQIQAWLENACQRAVSLQTIRLHSNSPLAAKHFIEQEKECIYHQLLSDFADFVIHQRDLFSLVVQAQKQEQALEWLSLSLLDAVKIQQDPKLDIVHIDARAQIEQIATLPTALLVAQYQSLNQLNAKLKKQTGLNTELLLSQWFMRFIYLEN